MRWLDQALNLRLRAELRRAFAAEAAAEERADQELRERVWRRLEAQLPRPSRPRRTPHLWLASTAMAAVLAAVVLPRLHRRAGEIHGTGAGNEWTDAWTKMRPGASTRMLADGRVDAVARGSAPTAAAAGSSAATKDTAPAAAMGGGETTAPAGSGGIKDAGGETFATLGLRLAAVTGGKPHPLLDGATVAVGTPLIFHLEAPGASAANALIAELSYSLRPDPEQPPAPAAETALGRYPLAEPRLALQTGDQYVSFTPDAPGLYIFRVKPVGKRTDHEVTFSVNVAR